MESSQQWSLFGFDLRQVYYYIRSGWRDFLWGDRSPVLEAVDEVVRVQGSSDGVLFYRAGQKVATPADINTVDAQAIILPDALTLAKPLKIPTAAEAEVESVVALEVSTNSPFSADDTSYGWAFGERGETNIELQLVISSRSAVMAHIAKQYDNHDVKAYEVWAPVGEQIVVLSGFGEAQREQRNLRRIARLAATVAYCLAALVLLFALSAGSKYLELQRVQAVQAQVQSEAVEVLGVREQLVASKELIAAAQELTLTLPPPYGELKRLTKVLGDDTWLSAADVKGPQVKLEGESGNAAAVMQQLLNDPAYSRVESPVAFKKVRSGKERFVLNLTRSMSGEVQ